MNMIDTKSTLMAGAVADTTSPDAAQPAFTQAKATHHDAMQPGDKAGARELHPEQTLAEQIAELSQWLAETDIGLLELRTAKGRIKLMRNAGCGSVEPGPFDADATAHDGELLASQAEPTESVVASSVGIFLRSHPLRDEPLASIGDRVEAGQILGLLQIGALLLPVSASISGTLVEALAADGNAVGYGTPLFSISAS